MSAFSTVELLVCKVVLHSVDEDGVNCAALLLLELIPGNNIPVSNESEDFTVATHLHKESGRGNVTTTDKNTVR